MEWLEDYRKRAFEEGICDEYRKRWGKCHTKKDIMDMALSVRAVDYICSSIALGWGRLSSEAIIEDFGRYVNGSYSRDCGGYLSEMYCGYSGKIVARKTILTLIHCGKVEVIIPKGYIIQVYVVGEGTNITFSCEKEQEITYEMMSISKPCSYLESKAYATIYGEGVNVSDDGKVRVHISTKCGVEEKKRLSKKA